MKLSKSLDQFMKLYWDDLTPEQINYIGQCQNDAVHLEAESAALKRENKGLLGIVSAYHPEYLRGCDCPQCKKPLITCLCGSSRFVDIMAVVGWLLERDEGRLVMGLHLLPHWYPDVPEHHLAEAEGVAEQMDDLHLRKIDLADEIYVIDWQGYIGESTSREIEYAKANKKIVLYLTQDPERLAFVRDALVAGTCYEDEQEGESTKTVLVYEGEEHELKSEESDADTDNVRSESVGDD